MRIVLDLQGLQGQDRCAGHHTLALALAIARNCGKHEILLVLNGFFPETVESVRAHFDSLLPQENIRIWHAPWHIRAGDADNTWRREVAEHIREAFLAGLQPDIVYVPNLSETALFDDESAGAESPNRGAEPISSPIWDDRAKRAIAAFEKTPASPVGTPGLKDHDALRFRLIESIAAIIPGGVQNNHLVAIARAIATSLPATQEKQIFLDVSAMVQEDAKTGIQRVTRSILREFINNSPDGYKVEPVYATPTSNGYRYARHYTAGFLARECEGADEEIECRPGDIFLGLDLLHHTQINQHDYLMQLRRDGVKILVVVYDLLPIAMPQNFVLEANLHQKWLETITDFDGAVCISRAVADELVDWLAIHGRTRLRPFQVNWFHLGGDIQSSVPSFGMPEDAQVVLDRLAQAPSFLMVSTVEPRKGHQQTLEAFELLWARGVDANLVIVGKQGWQKAIAALLHNHPQFGKHLFWLKGISDEYLEKVYAASACLVAASEGEGFGLPIVEAAQHQLPILARDIPVFREIAGEHAFYFDGLEPARLATALEKWLLLDAVGAAPQSSGIQQLTWAESAEQLKRRICGHGGYKQWPPKNT